MGFFARGLATVWFWGKWRSWISILLSTNSIAVLLNGARGRSPMLFILVMESLQKLFENAAKGGLLSPLNARAASLRVSFYADDATVFVQSTNDDVAVVVGILDLFGDVLGS